MKVVFIGAGNLAWHLSSFLQKKGIEIAQIFDINYSKAKELADILKTDSVSEVDKLSEKADLYIISVTDTAISEVANNRIVKGKINKKLVVHTSGGVHMNSLINLSENIGVLYPVSTFSRNNEIDFLDKYFCIEANSDANLKKIKDFTKLFTENVREINSEQRKILHLSAVFACNFSNHMYAIADKIMSDNDMDFDLLLPLIDETTKKIHKINPKDAQTGPAARGDKIIIENHIETLKNYPELIKIYSFVSKSIENLTKN